MTDATLPTKECDIIMKGGITSGVVYPKGIIGLSEHYRFRSIGGTSAGAIAAVITAAAEYNRQGNGFEVVAKIPEEVQEKLQTLFQPSPKLRDVFNFGLDAMAGRKAAGAWNLIRSNLSYLLAGLAAGAILAAIAVEFGSYFGAFLLVLMGALAGLLLVGYVVVTRTLRDIVSLDFGFCPGPTQPGYSDKGVSDWLAEKIEIAAGRMEEGGLCPKDPLTFNDIWRGKNGGGTSEKPAIDLRMMTTNLSLRRPHALPHMDRNNFFKEEDFRRLFPGWVVDYMMRIGGERFEEEKRRYPRLANTPPEYHMFPVEGDLPLIVAARMSLSFPILFTTVPLYRRDFPHEKQNGPAILELMRFSDGGLSSNFPVHFFDALLPTRPTFGISLEAFDDRDDKRRVHLAMRAGDNIWLDNAKIGNLKNFFMSLIYAAKDWQDRLQSTLPGYRERIAGVYLKNNEGGLNLAMTSEQIAALINFGERAGGLLNGTSLSADDKQPFDFDDHRWRRFLVAFARLEETLQQAATSWYGASAPTRDFIKNYMVNPKSYDSSTLEWRDQVFDRFDCLMSLVHEWNGSLRDSGKAKSYIPRPQTTMRITPVS
jgi:hypothetical protein